MNRSQYVDKIIGEVVGQEYLRVDTETPGYRRFFKAHTPGLSAESAAQFAPWFRGQMQFVSDLSYCYLALWLDYSRGRVTYPANAVVRDVIAKLVAVHFKEQAGFILRNKECRDAIERYGTVVGRLVKASDSGDIVQLGNVEVPSIQAKAMVDGHQLVNIISIILTEEHARRLRKGSSSRPRRTYGSPTQATRSRVHSRGAVNWCQRTAGSDGSQGFPASASRMASSAVMPWAAAESR